MRKVKITADGVLGIIKSILTTKDVDIIDDPNALKDWRGKSIHDALAVEYFTFKRRAVSTEQLTDMARREGYPVDTLAATKRSFASFVLGDVERLFTTDVDVAACEGVLDYWIQTDKVKFLELLFEKVNIALTGLRLPVDFVVGKEGGANVIETRQAVVIFDKPDVPEVNPEDMIGEAVRCSVGVTIEFNPAVTTYSDYMVEMAVDTIPQGGQLVPNFVRVPVINVVFDAQMTQDSIPLANQNERTGVINLARGRTLKLTFEGIRNYVIDWIADQTLKMVDIADNNTPITVRLTRNGIAYTIPMVVIAHGITVSNNIESEMHTLSLAERGMNDGST